jgi:hypothetical protein
MQELYQNPRVAVKQNHRNIITPSLILIHLPRLAKTTRTRQCNSKPYNKSPHLENYTDQASRGRRLAGEWFTVRSHQHNNLGNKQNLCAECSPAPLRLGNSGGDRKNKSVLEKFIHFRFEHYNKTLKN